ncbi:TetR/AcrR family transcriptional regulator [Pseudonocardia sp.]|uniref:TetR/AcrR family transcriptional regulator n=1 Tax=Pseudonocardia sp. TaxID=60912 RepID=UPI002611915E|nr:TetR/AcrR family transcriptional regulator [Pseudonocardia sp.]
MVPARPARARRLAPEARRRALVEATLPLVLRHGAAVSTRQIAEAACVAEGTIFSVFPHKEALMRAVTAAALDPASTLRELAGIDRSLPLRARLVAAVQILQSRLTGVFGLIDALQLARPPAPRPPDDECPSPRMMNEAFQEAVVDVIGPDSAALRVPATELARVLRLLVFSGTHPRLCDGPPLSAERIVTTVLDGLAHHHTDTHHIEGEPC